MSFQQFYFKVKKNILLNKKIRNSILYELLALLSLIAGFSLELWHIASTSLIGLFFNNSDGLTLSLLDQSIRLKEPFNWVFSSQIFLFPEGVLYAFSALFSSNFKAILVINAFLNCLLLYSLLRFLYAQFSVSKQISRVASLLSTLYVLLLSFLELRDNQNVATNFLLVTVYYGVVLSALAALTLSVQILRSKHLSLRSRNFCIKILLLFCVGFLTSLSNPLYLLQFMAPFIVVVGLGLLINVFPLKKAMLVVLPQFIGAIAGVLVSKLFFKKLFSSLGGVNAYFHLDSIGYTMRFFRDLLKQMLASNRSRIELIFVVIFISFSILLLIAFVRSITNPDIGKKYRILLSPSTFLLVAFAGIAPVSTFLGVVLTGNPTPRYLLTLIIFPLISIIPMSQLKIFKRPFIVKMLNRSVLFLAVILIGLSLIFANPISAYRVATEYYPPDSQCLDTQLSDKPYKAGVAQYWRARGLQLNSKKSIKVLQVLNGGLGPFNWLYNQASYYVYDVSFVVVDKVPSPYYDAEVSNVFAIDGDTVKLVLGDPTEVLHCPTFDIYAYSADNPGRRLLNDHIRQHNQN